MTLARVKSWVTEVLTATDLNAEFNNILNYLNGSTIAIPGLLDLSSTGQVKFPATQNSSADPNTLDDYEEGTWTPTDASGAGLTFSVALGRYTKFGSQVEFSGAITFPATADVNSVQFGGLPFTASNAIAVNMDGAAINNTDSGRLDLLLVNRNSTQILLRNTSNAPVTNATYTGKSLSFCGVYRATA